MIDLAFERADWTAFRTVEGLQRRAGTSADKLAAVVVKEMVDNALDAAGDCELGLIDGTIVVEDQGDGIPGDDDELARIFSIDRPQISSKYLRLPTRGSLGNGLRVVVGAVLATGGKLFVSTQGRRLEIIPKQSGGSLVRRVGDASHRGTRIEVRLGSPLIPTDDDLELGLCAIDAARGQKDGYKGKTSPHWYDADAFHELVMSVRDGDTTARAFIGQFDGCRNKAGEIAAEYKGVPVRDLTRDQAAGLLRNAKAASTPVKAARLGSSEPDAFPGHYARTTTDVMASRGGDGDRVSIPAVVEAWADIDPDLEDPYLTVMVNGTPSLGKADAWQSWDGKTTRVQGDGLSFDIKTGKHFVSLTVNIITPYMPITTDGKSPALGRFAEAIEGTVVKAWKLAKRGLPAEERAAEERPERPERPERVTIKDVVLAHMEETIVDVSTDRTYRFHWRQVFYRLRPIVMQEAGRELLYGTFDGIVKEDYLSGHDEPMAYRDSRGTVYGPHGAGDFPLGTLEVEKYERPAYVYNKVLVIEKEGFFEALKAEGWPERHDCLLLTSKGQPTAAARDIIDLIGETEEPVQVFLLHDCDAAGTMIYQSYQEATRTHRRRRNVEIVNLGLDVEEALAWADLGRIEIEDVSYDKVQPVAEYAGVHKAWFQRHRVELNALTTKEFIDWLDDKLEPYEREVMGKVIPPDDYMAIILRSRLAGRLRERITRRILAEAKIDDQVKAAVDALAPQVKAKVEGLRKAVADGLVADRRRYWSNVVEVEAVKLAE